MIARRERDRSVRVRWRERLRLPGAITGGGADGNERLTTITGAILLVLLALIGFTIPQLRQYVRVFRSLVLFAEQELPSSSLAVPAQP